LDVIIVFLEQRSNHIILLVQFMKHWQLARRVEDSHALSFVEKEAMAPRTAGGLTGGMAYRYRIHRVPYEDDYYMWA
jgi:hypothetical protein